MRWLDQARRMKTIKKEFNKCRLLSNREYKLWRGDLLLLNKELCSQIEKGIQTREYLQILLIKWKLKYFQWNKMWIF